ncbi:MAG: NADPH:quinone reductase-like Zn-dependent oxidoreductase [Saprospiraceae bacterium]|jgi:NADPH:quinone reductase-like Zn-dependent oxidoreductase
MKATTVKHPGGFDHLTIIEKKDPEPKAGEILVRWHATSLNYHDYLVANGSIPVMDGRIPMSDGAGEIIALGQDVLDWEVGDKVMSMFFQGWQEGRPTLMKMAALSGELVDGFAIEKSCVLANAVTAIPEGYSYTEAATLPCAAVTAWRALIVEGKLQPGDTVLIEGTGGMSIFALQIAKAAGAKIYATTSSEEKAVRLKAMGVEAVVNYKEDTRWGKTISRMTDGGVDHVLDVGGGSTMNNSIEAAAIGGHIASIGILGNGRKGEITFPKLFFKHLRMTGLAVGSREMQVKMIDAINIAGFKPVIDKTFAFDQLADAFRYQESGAHFGKIVLAY